jgi:D-proline reductase (dithiol) PrdB
MGRFKNRMLARLLTRFPKLLDRVVEKTPVFKVAGIPWTPFTKRIEDSVVALVTTAGVHLRDQRPFDMLDKDGDPSYRALPSDAGVGDYVITHDYYDHTDADRDINIVFPIERLKEFASEGAIGGLARTNYGFMGHIDGPHIKTLVEVTAPEVASAIRAEGVDVALLTPG